MAALREAAPEAIPAPDLPAALDLAGDPAVAAGSLRLVGAILEYAGGGMP